jgi:hypothetical protein
VYDKKEGKIRSARQDGLPLLILGGFNRIGIVVVCSHIESAHRHRLPTLLNQPRLRCCPFDSRLPTPDSIVNRSFSISRTLSLWELLFAFSPQRALVHVISPPISRPRPIRFTTHCEIPLYYTPHSSASPHQFHHTVNTIFDSVGHINNDHSIFPDDKTRPTDPHHLTLWSSFVIVYYTTNFPLIASLPFLFYLDRFKGMGHLRLVS